MVKPLPHKQADLQDPGTHIPWCICSTREWRQANPQREPAKPVYRRGFRVSDRPLQRIRWRAKKEDTQCGPIFTLPKEMYSSFKVNNDSTSKHESQNNVYMTIETTIIIFDKCTIDCNFRHFSAKLQV